MSYKKEFIVSKIETSEDNSSYVYVSIYTKSHFSPTKRQQGFPENPFGVAAIPITSLDDLKNLPKKISDALESYKNNFKLYFHTKSLYDPPSILFTTVNFTSIFQSDYKYADDASAAYLLLKLKFKLQVIMADIMFLVMETV